MKFIEECYGLTSASSHYSCIYCETNLMKPWEYGDENKIIPINRTLAEAKKIVKNKHSNKDDIKGYIHFPIVHIDFNMIVIDTLHMLLRISDKLFESLITILNRNDEDSTSYDFKKRLNLKIFLDILKNDCNISNPFYKSQKDTEKIKIRSLNGSEREIIFTYFSGILDENHLGKNLFLESLKIKSKKLVEIFPSIDEMKNFDRVFRSFWKLFLKVKNYKKGDDLEKLDKLLRSWLNLYHPFVKTLDSTISPYVHIFVYHIRELIELHNHLSDFYSCHTWKCN